MSISSIEAHAMQAQSVADTNEKLNEIANALFDIAKVLDDIESRLRRI